MKNKFYVYEHWRPDKDVCFYVGKGAGPRANMMARRNPHHKAVQKKLHKLGFAVEVRIVSSSMSEDDAFTLEIERIIFWRTAGIKLTNKSDGGEGSAGHIQKKGKDSPFYGKPGIWKGKKLSEETCRKLSVAMKGKKNRLGIKHSDEAKAKMSASAKGRVSWCKGMTRSQEYRMKISETLKGRYVGEENPFFGRKHSDETKRKISETKKRASSKMSVE